MSGPELTNPGRPSPLRILIVEDNPLTAQLLEEFLGLQHDFQVVGLATSGEDALLQVPRLQPDLVLMDVEMPGMNGLETTRHLKAKYTDLRIIIVSVHETQEIHHAARASGAAAFVSKAHLVQDLVPAIEQLWRGESDSEERQS